MLPASAESRALVAQVLRFLVVGGTVVGVDFVVYFALVTFAPAVPIPTAKALSFIAGACLAFALNRRFVFQADGAATRQAGPFILLYLVRLGLNNAMNALALAQGAQKPLAWLLATATSTISNFLGMKLIVFRRKTS